MKSFTVYDGEGRILRTGICQDETFEAQAMNPGEVVAEFSGDWATQYVVDGALVSRPPTSVSLSQSGGEITLTGVKASIRPQLTSATETVDMLATDDGGPITATLDSGSYTVVVDQFPELPFSQQITIP